MNGIAALAAQNFLDILGGFHPEPGDGAPDGTRTLLLLGPAEPGFWRHLRSQPEWSDSTADPIDRWSRRVIGRMACDLGAKALFPFTGPPWHPFQKWALRSGQAWASPVRLLVHERAGLMVSFRGALALKERIDLAPAGARPCDDCDGQPCTAACPTAALTISGYDVPACHDFLDSPEGSDCMSHGCRVRRACPVSQRYGRVPEQSAYHMRQFHK